MYFVHTSAREGVDAIGEARSLDLPVYGETLHQYACFNAEHYKTPRGFCSHTYPSLKFPEDQAALWRGLVNSPLSTLATDEYPTPLALKLKGKTIEDVTGGNTGAEARMGIGYTEGVVKRRRWLEGFPALPPPHAARPQAQGQDHRERHRRQHRRRGANGHRLHGRRGEAADVAPGLRRHHLPSVPCILVLLRSGLQASELPHHLRR